jgi:hypothetical protein
MRLLLLEALLVLCLRKLDAGHELQGLRVEALGDDLGLEPDQVAREVGEALLPGRHAKPGPLALDVLRGRGFVGLGRPADDVREPGDLVDRLLHDLARSSSCRMIFARPSIGSLVPDVGEAALLHQGRPVLDGR